MNRDEVLSICKQALEKGGRPNLSYANLSYAILEGADLHGVDLSYADLSYADLSYADLHGANLRYADLSDAILEGADLHGVDLSYADLSYAYLSGADLRDADLSGADLWRTAWDGLCVDGLLRGRCLLIPTPHGWVVQAGEWSGAVDQLRQRTAHDDDAPDAIAVVRRLHAAFCDMCDAHIAEHPHVIDDLATRWLP
ncbi:pentapeptide repeat-containing protein [Acidipropionibacterium timonense]|uniref:pentapeptide repeat-containing protein n=1 Tax=Acidipropionibacterium timonense TaxID=2161818 RepID=UPI00102F94EE|nr:pentapeptide repeat-containing protein [Acidipropionibacterium timonense]